MDGFGEKSREVFMYNIQSIFYNLSGHLFFFLLPNKRMYYKLNSLLISLFIVTYLSLIKIKTHVNVAKVESMIVELGKKKNFCQPLCQELSKQNQHRIYL